MDASTLLAFITHHFPGVETVTDDDNTFFFHGAYRQMPWATLVTKDDYDQVSNLNRPGIYRLNIGIGKATFVGLLGTPSPPPGPSGHVESGHDYTALDRLMPHPVYGNLFWVCVLNPGPATWETVQTLLQEAHTNAARKHPSGTA